MLIPSLAQILHLLQAGGGPFQDNIFVKETIPTFWIIGLSAETRIRQKVKLPL
jgi:hypothetical protein